MRIAKANRKAVERACTAFHYAKSIPALQYGYNIYNDANEWCGCILFGGGANNNMSKSFGCNNGEVLELERVALNGKQEHTSQAVAMALKQLHKDDPLCRMVVSYSDHRQKHIGTIYQATNFIYLGISETSDTQYYYNGKWTHERTINSKPKQERERLKRTLPKRENSNKFKYLYVFNKRERKQWQKKALPYPKDKDLTDCSMQVDKKRLSVEDK